MTGPIEPNPYASPVNASGLREPSRPFRRTLLVRWLLVLHALVILAALGVEAYRHETITFSGPVFALSGLCIAVIASRQEDMSATSVGVSAIAFTCLIVFLINFNGWMPAEGDRPITLLSLAYAAIVLPLIVWQLLQRGDEE